MFYSNSKNINIIPFFKDKLLLLTDHIHQKVFGQPVGERMRRFIKNVGWVSLGTLGGAAFLFVTNVAAGRLLGPTEYGKYSLIVSLGQIFIIPMIFGINTASIKYISSAKNKQKKKILAQNTIFLSILFTSITSIAYLIFRSQIFNLLRINNQIFIFTLIFSIFLSFKYVSEAIIKGFRQFKLLSWLEFINSFSVFIFFFAYIFLFKRFNYQSYIIPIIISSLIYIFIFLTKHYRKLILPIVSKNILKTIIGYGKFATVGAISGMAISNVDKLILNKYTSLADIGTYSIYLGSSSFIGSYLLQIFLQVFFPTISSIKEKKQISNKILKLIIFTAIPIFLFNVCSTSVILFLMGSKYEKNLVYLLLFSFLGMLTIFSNIFWWLIASFGKKGIRFTSLTGVALGIINISMLSFLTKTLGITGTVYSLIITNILIIITSVLKTRSSKNEN